jgi:hypothetical protein
LFIIFFSECSSPFPSPAFSTTSFLSSFTPSVTLQQFYFTPSLNASCDISSINTQQFTPYSGFYFPSSIPSQSFYSDLKIPLDYYKPSTHNVLGSSSIDFTRSIFTSNQTDILPPLPPPPIIHERRILVYHGGLSSMIPSLNVLLEMPMLEHFDYFRECEDPTFKKFVFGHYRKRFFFF